MTISFIYSSDPFNPKKVDESFLAEYELARNKNFKTYLINTDDLINSKIFPALEVNDSLIYRGWMLTKSNYELLEKKVNYQLLTNTSSYIFAHHLPNWYPELKEFTMDSKFSTGKETNDLKSLYKSWGGKPAFVKDYVKSLKTGAVPIVNNESELFDLVKKMEKYRGCIEGGIVLREPIDLIQSSETRFFILNGKLFNNGKNINDSMVEMAQNIVNKLGDKSNFYSMDLILDKKEKYWLIEIGDGQVSDSVGWDLENFLSIFKSIPHKKLLKP